MRSLNKLGWAYRAVVSLGKTLNANIPTIAAAQLSEYESKLAIARMSILGSVSKLGDALL